MARLTISGIVLMLVCVVGVEAQVKTVRVSVDSAGNQGDWNSAFPALSEHGLFAAFESGAKNLVPGDNNGDYDIFVHDLTTGQTTRVSMSTTGEEPNDTSKWPTISDDGRYVAFCSYADNLVPLDTNWSPDIFVHDRLTAETKRVSVNASGTQANNGSLHAVISGDGHYVVFRSGATNLVPTGDANPYGDIFLKDLVTDEVFMVSYNSAGVQSNGPCQNPDLSQDARFIVFSCSADNMVPNDTNMNEDIFVRDRLTGTTERVSVSSTGAEADGNSEWANISADGRYVTFQSEAEDLVPNDSNSTMDIFRHDRLTGVTELVSVNLSGQSCYGGAKDADISHDGRYVLFLSGANDLILNDTNVHLDAFVRDMDTGVTRRVNVSSSGEEADGSCDFWPAFSPDGWHLIFCSYAHNLVPGDTNYMYDIFVHSINTLDADTYTLPASTGGTVNLTINAGADNGNRNYLILGGVTGIEPGFPLPGGLATLPLNWDVFTDFVLGFLNSPAFMNFMGKLDATGGGAAQVNSPALPPTAEGLRMYFAYCLNAPFDFVSNPRIVDIVP